MPDFSIICCISKPNVFADCLLRSINENRSKFDIEIIPVFNDENRYSASNALNVGIDAARSDIVVFAHQDVRLLYNWFELLNNIVTTLPNDWGILGAAGISLDYGRSDIGHWGGALRTDTVAVGSVWDSDDKLNSPPYWDGIKKTTKIHCADECLLVLNKRTGLRFDAQFTGFHFYGVDLCLQARAAAYDVYGGHLPIIHYGNYSASFTGNNRYWFYLRFLYNKWRLRFPELLGTHMHWSQASYELTSYINVNMTDDEGSSIHLRSMGIGKVKLKNDKQHGILDNI